MKQAQFLIVWLLLSSAELEIVDVDGSSHGTRRMIAVSVDAQLQDCSKVETGPRIERQRAWVLIRPTLVATRDNSTKTKEVIATMESADGTSDSDSESDDTR